MTETIATAQQIEARRGDLVLVEMRPSYTTSSYKREESESQEYRLMVVTNLFRDGRIKKVRDARYGGNSYAQELDGMLHATGRHWLLPAAGWDTAKAQQLAVGHVYPNSTTPRDFPTLDAAREALAPARHGYVAPKPEIPQPTPAREHGRCNHGQADTVGYVVAFSHLSGNEVTFEDIEYVDGAANYGRALEIVRGARAVIERGIKDATYAVIHPVYADGHRMV
jgi:hypothetical protein